jgi:hypothetical protein
VLEVKMKNIELLYSELLQQAVNTKSASMFLFIYFFFSVLLPGVSLIEHSFKGSARKMEDKQWLLKLSQLKNATRKVTIITKSTTQLNSSSSLDNDIFEYDANNEFISSLSLLTLIILYGIVVFSGICGNSTLLISLCSQSTARVKNPLLLALCTADLLVSLVSAPLTIIGVILRMQSRTMSYVVVNIGCKAFHYLQVCIVCLINRIYMIHALNNQNKSILNYK